MAVTERDIYSCANIMVKNYSEDAVIFAAKKADEFLDQSDLDGQAVWKRIMRAINDLQAETGPVQ